MPCLYGGGYDGRSAALRHTVVGMIAGLNLFPDSLQRAGDDERLKDTKESVASVLSNPAITRLDVAPEKRTP